MGCSAFRVHICSKLLSFRKLDVPPYEIGHRFSSLKISHRGPGIRVKELRSDRALHRRDFRLVAGWLYRNTF